MADHRKSFRPRRVVLGASFLLVATLLPAFAEDAGLKNGAASLAAGKYDNAVRMLSSTINSDNASPGEAAKALYLRGIAYRKLGQPSRAIADLGAAIFLGLPDQDRVRRSGQSRARLSGCRPLDARRRRDRPSAQGRRQQPGGSADRRGRRRSARRRVDRRLLDLGLARGAIKRSECRSEPRRRRPKARPRRRMRQVNGPRRRTRERARVRAAVA